MRLRDESHRPHARRREPGHSEETAQLLVTNPDTEIVDIGATVWLVIAVPDPGIQAAIEAGASFDEVCRLLRDSAGEYTLVQVSAGDELTVRAHRGVTSSYEVFFLRGSDGQVVVTDLFRNALAQLDPEDRTVTDDIVASHLLYRAVPTGSYVAEVDRLRHGESLTWTPAEEPPVRELTESLSAQPECDDGRTALDDALRRGMAYDSADGLVSMLSGGVDSTLLHTYLPGNTPSTSSAFETPEFDFEVDYAKTASSLLETDHDLVTAPEETFGARLEATIDAIGMPPQQLQAPTIDMCLGETPHDVYVCGEVADSLYGMGAGTAQTVWKTRALRHLPAVHPSLRTHEDRAEKLLRSPWHPRGFAQQSSQYTDQDYVAECVGKRLVDRQQRRRLEYASARVPLVEDTDQFAAHVDWGHWIGRLCENTLTAYRQIAHARGKALRAPFATRAVTEAALSVPVPRRYVADRESKHIPKRLLDHHLPEYETSKPKGNGNLPEGRFLRDGPLSPLQEQYSLPSFVPESTWDDVVERSPGMGWILLSWAVWRDRVLDADSLSPVAHTRTVEVAP